MLLSDSTILKKMSSGEISIAPYPAVANMNPCSIDLTLSNKMREPRLLANAGFYLNEPRNVLWENLNLMWKPEIEVDAYVLWPGTTALGKTAENVKIPNYLCGIIDGRSILGRYGLQVHQTAEHIHPGYQGQIVLEFSNISNARLILTPGMRICTLYFEKLDEACEKPYRNTQT